jgi:peptidoglycan/LPS O-acetylase OafA/YrhL
MDELAFGSNAFQRMNSKRDLPFIFGIRGISAIYVMLFHLNYIVVGSLPFDPPVTYRALTDWIRYGDFRVAAFFVVSGYLLMIPPTRTPGWLLPHGTAAFLKRRAERLLYPYYAAFALSVILFVVWKLLVGQPIHPKMLVGAIVSHVLLVHNLFPQTMLLVNDTLWNVALEFQCYVLFAFVLLPLLRRTGPWTQFALVLLLALVPHFVFHGFLDWVRPWFVALYALGVATMAISNRNHPQLQRYERRVPWGALWIVSAALTPVAIFASGIDAPYGAGWLQNLLLGCSVASFLVFTRLGAPGVLGGAARVTISFLQFMPLRRLGMYSYSIYLIHYPILRLLCAIAARFTQSFFVLGGLALFVFVPFTLWLAFQFHVRFERPFQVKRDNPAAQELAAEAAG